MVQRTEYPPRFHSNNIFFRGAVKTCALDTKSFPRAEPCLVLTLGCLSRKGGIVALSINFCLGNLINVWPVGKQQRGLAIYPVVLLIALHD